MGVNEVLARNFPTSSSAVIFVLYMAMFVAQGMLVTASRHGGTDYTYNTVTVVLLTEGLKLLLSSGVYLRDKTATSLVEEVVRWVILCSFQSKQKLPGTGKCCCCTSCRPPSTASTTTSPSSVSHTSTPPHTSCSCR